MKTNRPASAAAFQIGSNAGSSSPFPRPAEPMITPRMCGCPAMRFSSAAQVSGRCSAKTPKPKQPAGGGRANRLEIVVELRGQCRRLFRLDEIDPRVGRAYDRNGDAVMIHESELAAHLVELAADRPAGRGRGVGFLVGQDDQPIASGTRNDARHLLALAQQGDITRQVHVGVDIDQRQGHGRRSSRKGEQTEASGAPP